MSGPRRPAEGRMRSGTGWQAAGRALFGRRARLRWVHLVLGGALLMPFWLVGTVALGPLTGEQDMWSRSPAFLFGAYGVALPLAAVAGLFPTARRLSVAVARALCGIPGERLADGHARTRAGRVRTAGWCTLHMGVGALVSGTSLALPPFAVALIAVPLFPGVRNYLRIEPSVWSSVLLPLAGTALLLALAAVSAAAGALLARWAQVLLGPTPADRLAAAERRATELAERNRLARELHDSVGHALSAVALQAGAARRVLDSDRDSDVEFVREALAAIEEITRRTVGELDAVLGLLRQDVDGAERPGGPTLGTLDGLLSRSGVRVSLHAEGPLTAVPAPISREAYRIVQEGLSNVLRHAGASPVTLWIAARDEELEIRMENPLPEQAPVVRPGGGRGLRGVAERATLLGGLAEAGPREGVWRLSARLPLDGRR